MLQDRKEEREGHTAQEGANEWSCFLIPFELSQFMWDNS